MFKPITTLTAIFLLFSTITLAQTDSSSYDLGIVSVKKEFTQSITIKGSDLEHNQFTNLANAINVWFYGTYSNTASLLYVIDGNIITDVNAYSIYDIDEITLVQNALAQVSGANANQQMVLIKLKTNKQGNQGIEANGQSSYVNLHNPPNSSSITNSTSFYNQFYVAGYKNYRHVNLGISTEYTHDVIPGVFFSNSGSYSFNSNNSSSFNRLKLNAFVKANLGKSNILNLRMNYTPQHLNDFNDYNYTPNSTSIYGSTIYTVNTYRKIEENMLNLNLSLDSKLGTNFTNTFSISLNRFNSKQEIDNNFNIKFDSQIIINKNSNASYKKNNLLIMDNFNYHKSWGNLNLNAMLNFSYQKVRDTTGYHIATVNSQLVESTNNYSQSYQAEEESVNLNYKFYYLAPSLNIDYNHYFNVQTGFIDILNSNIGNYADQTYPYITSTLNVGKLLGLKINEFFIYGSIAHQSQLLANNYQTLMDLNRDTELIANTDYEPGSSTIFIHYTPNLITSQHESYNSVQVGTKFNLSRNISLNYNFENRYYNTYVFFDDYTTNIVHLPGGAGMNVYAINFSNKVIINRFGLNYKINFNNVQLRSGINASSYKVQVKRFNIYSDNYFGNNLSEGYRWSGGFTNRISCNNFFAGMDLLFQIGDRYYNIDNLNSYPNSRYPKLDNNSFSLQNLYFGKQLKISKLNYAEVYLNGRNILQNNSSTITDNRRFFGAGFKVAL